MIANGTVVAGSAAACVGFVVIYLYIRTRQTPRGLFLPDSFLLGLLLFSAGGVTVAVQSPSTEAFTVAFLGNTAFLSGVIGSIVVVLASSSHYQGATFKWKLARVSLRRFDRTFAIVAGGAVVCVSVVFLYLVITGPMAVVFRSLSAFVSDAALLDVRKTIASGREGYLAPGYVKQFRDVLGPILLVYLGWQRWRGSRFARLLLLALLVLAILLSGQRAPLLILVLCILAGRHFARPRRKSRRAKEFGPPVLVLAIFLMLLTSMDLLLGRSRNDTPLWTAPVSSLSRLADRAIVTVPRSNVATFDLWMSRAPTHGESWIQDFTTLLPGPAGKMFTNVLHQAGGGSAEGNLVLGMAPDLWLGWGWPGVLIVPLLFAGCVAVLDAALYRSGSQIGLATRIYLFFALPLMYSPYGFALYGGSVALIILAAIAVWRELAHLSPERSRRDRELAIQSRRWPPGTLGIPGGT